ncbi:MAG: YfcE family phosphodiesterase [Candidatus Nanohaloarchaea archaeon]
MIAVISDSHVPSRAEEIPEKFHERLEKAELVVHCGDFDREGYYRELRNRYPEMVAVKGNCDFFDLPVSQSFEESGIEFGVYHGSGIHPRGDHETLADVAEDKLGVDVILTGHSHRQDAAKHGGKIILNPGSCTGVGGGTASEGPPEMMELELEDGELEVRKLRLREGKIEKEREEFEV